MIKQDLLNKIVRYMCFCLVTCFGMSSAVAGTFQSHKSIYQAARNFIRSDVISQRNNQAEIKIGTLDSRLKLKQCNKPLQAFLPGGSRDMGKITIGVKCKGANPWSLHVPVTISVFKKVLVASRQLQKGTVLTESDIKLKKMDLAKLHYGFFEELKQGTGKKLKRRLLAGAVLTPAILKNPQLIRRGQKINIMAQSGRMMVRMEGKALANGAVGERIKVMNEKSGKKLEGIITSSGEVKIDI
jgi:flagella basal body P-ring formation protein FlgA